MPYPQDRYNFGNALPNQAIPPQSNAFSPPQAAGNFASPNGQSYQQTGYNFGYLNGLPSQAIPPQSNAFSPPQAAGNFANSNGMPYPQDRYNFGNALPNQAIPPQSNAFSPPQAAGNFASPNGQSYQQTGYNFGYLNGLPNSQGFNQPYQIQQQVEPLPISNNPVQTSVLNPNTNSNRSNVEVVPNSSAEEMVDNTPKNKKQGLKPSDIVQIAEASSDSENDVESLREDGSNGIDVEVTTIHLNQAALRIDEKKMFGMKNSREKRSCSLLLKSLKVTIKTTSQSRYLWLAPIV